MRLTAASTADGSPMLTYMMSYQFRAAEARHYESRRPPLAGAHAIEASGRSVTAKLIVY